MKNALKLLSLFFVFLTASSKLAMAADPFTVGFEDREEGLRIINVRFNQGLIDEINEEALCGQIYRYRRGGCYNRNQICFENISEENHVLAFENFVGLLQSRETWFDFDIEITNINEFSERAQIIQDRIEHDINERARAAREAEERERRGERRRERREDMDENNPGIPARYSDSD